jgi:hypothetical protein
LVALLVHFLYYPQRTCSEADFAKALELDWNLILSLDRPWNFFLLYLYRTENRYLVPPVSFGISVSLLAILAWLARKTTKEAVACLFSQPLPSEQ